MQPNEQTHPRKAPHIDVFDSDVAISTTSLPACGFILDV